MKKIIFILLTLLMCTSVFAQVQQVDPILLVKTLEKNRNTEITFVTELNLNNLGWDNEGNLKLTTANSEKYSLIAEIETEFLRERLNYKNQKYKVSFQLKSSKPKVYAVTKIEGLETVAEYKARIEAERLARLEAERIAEEKRLESERIAEENRKKLEIGLPIYKNHLSKAKEYESKKRYAYALGAYYDAMGVDFAPDEKQEAINGYTTLVKSILSGNPGLGSYNEFTIHDEWKNLLIDAEKFGCSFNPFEVTVGNLVKGDLDYTTKTASYSASISYKVGNRYKYTIGIIENGYKKAYKEDWKDLPKEWPTYSVSYKGNDVYNVEGVCIFAVKKDKFSNAHYNAFAVNELRHAEIVLGRNMWNSFNTLMDCKFNIVDENGKELVKPVRCLLGYENTVTFKGITPDVMDLIENRKVSINPINYYLQYGKYYSPQDYGGRALIKDFAELKLPIDTAVFNNGDNVIDKTYKAVCDAVSNSFKMVEIIGNNIEMSETEVTEELYLSVMGNNPSESGGAFYPVTNVSWIDAINFCNKLSIAKGLEPVYKIPSMFNSEFFEVEVEDKRKIAEQLDNTPISINTNANGYRLPYRRELSFVVNFSETKEDDCIYLKGDRKQPVAMNGSNDYGLYDVLGNVYEWTNDNEKTQYYTNLYRYYTGSYWNGIDFGNYVSESARCWGRSYDIGFRLVRNK